MKSVLLYLSEQPKLRQFAVGSRVSRNTARRFVAGESSEEAITAVKELNRKGFSGTLDYLGENVSTKEEAQAATNEYVRDLDMIESAKVNCNVSLKLTQFGLDLSEDLCRENVDQVIKRAGSYGNFVRVDMEGSAYTDSTLRVFSALRKVHTNVGIVIQAYLFRSDKDIRDVLQLKSRVRLCKGAYKEPPEISFKKKSDTDRNYINLMKVLLKSGIYHGIATHDPNMISATKQFAQSEKIDKNQFEFQMLYGIRRDLQEQLIGEGFNLRVYVPYGKEWYPYLMRRMAERPANLLFVLRNLIRG